VCACATTARGVGAPAFTATTSFVLALLARRRRRR
jgi:hypothetical protein